VGVAEGTHLLGEHVGPRRRARPRGAVGVQAEQLSLVAEYRD
jgi:hypothetical protein